MSTQKQVDLAAKALETVKAANAATDEKHRALLTDIAVTDTLAATYPDVTKAQQADILRRTNKVSKLDASGLTVSTDNNTTIADHLKLMSVKAPHLFGKPSPQIMEGLGMTRQAFQSLPAAERLKILNRRVA